MKVVLTEEEIRRLLVQVIQNKNSEWGEIDDKECAFTMDGEEIDSQVIIEFIWTEKL